MHYKVFIGRFQPCHIGHYSVIRKALDEGVHTDKLIILLGTRNGARSLKNPWRTLERKDIINAALNDSDRERVLYGEIFDTLYNNTQWVANVQRVVHEIIVNDGARPANVQISLIGHSKDKSSFYLKLFPEWNSIEAPDYKGMNATKIRESLFDNVGIGIPDVSWSVNKFHARSVLEALQMPWFAKLQKEKHFLRDEYWPKYGYGQWNTVDSVVTLGGHILLVERGGEVGNGTWALPGGFLNKDERIVDAAVRELHEETGLKVPEPVLYGSIDQHDVYDIPDRDPRGRVITHAYHFNMINYGSFDKGTIRLPKVVGMDDAKQATWFTLHEMEDMKGKMFGDHYDIAKDLIGRATRKWN